MLVAYFIFVFFVLSPRLCPYALCSHYITTTFQHQATPWFQHRSNMCIANVLSCELCWLVYIMGVCVSVCVMCHVCVYMCTVHQPSSCPTAYKPSAAIMEDGPHCVKDKSGVCHRWEITVIYEVLSQQRQVNMHFGGLPAISPPFCIHKEKLAGIHCIFTWTLNGQTKRCCTETFGGVV